MIKTLLLFLLAFFLLSCSMMDKEVVKPNEKAFEQEDIYILFALRAEQKHDYKSASEIFEKLYEKSEKKEYIYRSLQDDFKTKSYKKILERVDTLLEKTPQDTQLLRFKVVTLIELKKLAKALEISVSLANRTKETRDYLLTSEIYKKREEFDLALKYLESAYAKENDEKILDQLSIVLYVNLHRKKEAIAHLETHSRVLGCSKLVCSRLISFYSNDNNIDGLLSTYLRYYEIDSSEKIARKIIQIYAYKQEYKKLISFLENSYKDDILLLQLYTTTKNYKKAYPLADKLYKETLDINYLGESAIFEYESSKDAISKKLLQNVITKLEKVINQESQPIYLNYLGYILIDHNIDILKGIEYIKKVLKIQPNYAFYLDSLAWGYYKLGECKKADSVMKKVEKLEGGDDPEVLRHIKAIQECLKNKKKVKNRK